MVQTTPKSLVGMHDMMLFTVVCLPNYVWIRFLMFFLRNPLAERTAGHPAQEHSDQGIEVGFD